MLAATRLSALAFAVLALVVVAWWARRAPMGTDTSISARDERRAILPMGPPSDFFMPRAVGDVVLEKSRPQISNVQIVDLDRDGLQDILVCDVIRDQVDLDSAVSRRRVYRDVGRRADPRAGARRGD